ncbi:MAG: hypothetical protein OXS30_13285 [Chloroflexota bacterium]|nr:hypothetical protein [Chloroflexota bacterium]
MATFEHKQLVERLARIEKVPNDESEVVTWMRGDEHLQFLRDDAKESELTIAALTRIPGPTCLNSYIVPVDLLSSREGALSFAAWSPNPYHHTAAKYSWGGGSDGVKPHFGNGGMGGPLPSGVSSLVFFRSTEGISGTSREVAQDFIHTAGAYWRRERNAHSKLDHRGDWLDVVSQSNGDDSAAVNLMSAHRETLDLHLVAVRSVLVRVFEFDLNRWPLGHHLDFDRSTKRVTTREPDFQYSELLIEGQLNRIRGAQVIRPRLAPKQVEQLVREGRIIDPSESEPVEFVVEDWRNMRIATVSTDPSTTTNYFVAKDNALPYETSPAYFRPEVLSRYKADREKYDLSDGWITCRGAWSLRNYSINDAGQVAAYICYLREIPREEQLYWKAFNEEPQTGLSERAIQNDFLGQWADESAPLEQLGLVLDGWQARRVDWWSAGSEYSHTDLTVPYGDNRDEWARAIVALSNAVVEGFQVKALRVRLRACGVTVDKQNRGIALLEQLMRALGVLEDGDKLEFLRDVSRLRSQAGGTHNTGTKAREEAHEVLEDHGSYGNHYEHLCQGLSGELEMIEAALNGG